MAVWVGACSKMRQIECLYFSVIFELERFIPLRLREDVIELFAIRIPADVKPVAPPFFRTIKTIISIIAFWTDYPVGF